MGGSRQTDESEKPNEAAEVQRIFRSFSLRMTSMRSFAEHLGPIADKQDDHNSKSLLLEMANALGLSLSPESLSAHANATIVASAIDTSLSDPHVEIRLDRDRLFSFAMNLRRSAAQHGALLRQSAMVMAVTQFDSLIADLLRCHYLNHPKSLDGESYAITFKELCELGSVDTARESVLSKKIESILYKSTRDQIDFFKKALKIDLSHLDPYVSFLDETIQRRHIWIHNGGKVSKLYIERVDSELIEKYNATEGAQLAVDPAYLRRAIDRVNLAGVILAQQCWRQWHPQERERADEAINDCVLDAICDARYTAAQYLGEYGIKMIKAPETVRLNMVLNLAQAYLWAGKADRAKTLVEKEDWSACSIKYKMCERIVSGDDEHAIRLLPAAVRTKEITSAEMSAWPIFKTFRLQPRVQEIMRSTASGGAPNTSGT